MVEKQGREDHLSAGRWLKETNYAKGGGWKKEATMSTMDPGGTSREEVIWVARKRQTVGRRGNEGRDNNAPLGTFY